VLASPPVVESSSRLGLLRRSPSFGNLFFATAGSSFGTYLAAVALVLQIKELTESGEWIAALLIADFLPIVLIGFLLGPLIDRLSRRRLMIVADLARFGVFAALPFVDSATGLVALAAVTGVATGFFFPAANAAIPNLVPEEELANANSLTVTVDTLAMTVGPVAGALLFAAWGPSVPYAVNAVTFLLSAALVARIPDRKLRSEDPLTRGHWRDVADGVKLVLTAKPGQSLPFIRAKVWVDARDALIRQFEAVDANGISRKVRILAMSPNAAVDQSAFRFDVPAGVRVIER